MKTDSTHQDQAPPPSNRDRARELRHAETDAEHKLWSRLRGRGLKVKFHRQHPIGPYIVDFFSLEANLVIELDGGQHNEDDAQTADAERTKFLEDRGYRVLRFWNNDVTGNLDGVLTRIAESL